MLRALQHIILAFSAIQLLMLVSCAPSPSTPIREGNRYATGFSIEQQDSSIQLTIYSPWHSSQVMGVYAIDRPYRRLASNACTHVGYIKELSSLGSLVGITDLNLVYTPLPDSVSDLGNSMTPDLEQILLCGADVMLLSTYAEGDATPERLRTLRIPIVYINEWQEMHPLARAEWIRVFGALTGHLNEADSIFNIVCANYNSPLLLTEGVGGCDLTHSPSLISGQDFRGTWYMPAGKTYMGQLFCDAGYAYRYADDERTQSIPLKTEQVIRDFQDADVWVGVQANSLDELAQIDEKHTWFSAYRSGQVYSFAKRTTATGGNDFWETGVVHPEYILRDLRLIRECFFSPDSLFFLRQLN